MATREEIQKAKLTMVLDAIEQVRGMKDTPPKRKTTQKKTEAKNEPVTVYEHDGKTPLPPGAIDGMEEFIEDEPITGLEWDISCENPPYVPHDFDMSTLPHPDKPHPKRFGEGHGDDE